MTLSSLLTWASILALSGITLETVARHENDPENSVVQVLMLSALRAQVTFQVYACGSWVVVKALVWIVLTIGV
jgi:hypothetical protein